MKKIKITLVVLIFGLVLGGAGCSFFAQNQPEQEEITQEPVEIKEEVDISDWQTYTNEEYGLSFRYPGEWKLENEGLPSNMIKIANIGPEQKEGTEIVDGAQIQFLILEKNGVVSEKDLINRYIQEQEKGMVRNGFFSSYEGVVFEGKVYYGKNRFENSFSKVSVFSNNNNVFVVIVSLIGDDFNSYLGTIDNIEKSFIIKENS
ncbi:MAG: hypothetical protein A2373_01275 [Candidatus Magasanikbacteria bacterium RIFOXYB1_FULL_40_15]|uniref:PsbP C-terminal domain-containing protein n=1 Tax=Candidatus Magasanikbacteria bacterium RIFOXYB1_FULL_40_15 TaxID=1798697 RepID=A0A1F6NIV9_9BACT|nr:MAG: hypothetical protein A2373_01275 [Candidatus Magasanikbacteria bacterium RIFOXYB1_FULL_40_15]